MQLVGALVLTLLLTLLLARPVAALSRVGSLTLNTGDNYLETGAIDTTNGNAYFSTYTNPSIVTKVDLATFTESSSVSLNSGEKIPYASTIDVPNGFVYVAAFAVPGIVVKVNIATATPSLTSIPGACISFLPKRTKKRGLAGN